MSRIYINSDEARIIKKDFCLVDVEFFTGEKMENLEPRRLFPISGLTKYISLLDSDGVEKAIIRNINSLMPQSRDVVNDCLKQYYLVPKISKVIDTCEKFGIIKWTVETERGIKTFEIRNRHHDIKTLYDGRILVRDSDDNRYEIPDYTCLDKGSLKHLIAYI